ncbi:lysophospholipid acyltransferase family protein [Streptomyces sp. NPDC044571]|uniref:lysophospholipid acyltransferase family protein n=1 Tax=Streptomyces sp. NPDC044571 TaxID=3155371 RepID=UPI0033CAAD70
MLRTALRTTLALLMRVAFRPHIEGAENVPATGPCIIAANHLSFSDHVFISLAVKRPVYFIGKAERLTGKGLKGRLTAAFFRAIGMVPVERDGGHGGVAALQLAEQVLGDGLIFGIHPEGTRSHDGRLYRGRTGVGYLALHTGAPVVACGLVGTEKVQPPGSLMLRPHRFTLRFGAPLDFSGLQGRSGEARLRRQVTDEVMQAIAALSHQEYVDMYATKAKTLASADR